MGNICSGAAVSNVMHLEISSLPSRDMVDVIEEAEQILRTLENLGMENIFCFGNK